LPMLFMGEEFGETNPFLYFVSHLDPDLVEAVRAGRKQEFADFQWEEEPPDPQSKETFARSKIEWGKKNLSPFRELLAFHCRLIAIRKQYITPLIPDRTATRVFRMGRDTIGLTYQSKKPLFCVFHLSDKEKMVSTDFLQPGIWSKILDSSEPQWNGSGPDLPDNLGNELSFTTYSLGAYGREDRS
ncbi:MAG: hypothetical protein ACOC0U_05725, partial [Desulfovibrionales bacterium]